MQINTVNNNVSFGRVIRIKSENKHSDKKLKELEGILNNGSSVNYNEEQEQKIRNFFVGVLGDYNGKDGISLEKNKFGDVFLLSGEEAKQLSSSITEQKCLGNKIPKADEETSRLICRLSENGKHYKPESLLIITSDSNSKNKINNIVYESMDIVYVQEKDGFSLHKEGKKTKRKSPDYWPKSLAMVSYDAKRLDFTA